MGFLCRLSRQDCPEDPKRLALGFLGVAGAAVWQIFRNNGLGPGIVAALIATAGPLGAMVYGVHRKLDGVLSSTTQEPQ